MESLSPLYDNLKRFVPLDTELEDQLASIARIATLKKREFLDQPGVVSHYRNYILQGAFYSYHLDADGKEHTVQIALEDWFVSDFYSYITQSPATLYVQAMEDSTLIQFHYNDIEALCKKSHLLSEYFRVTTEKAFAFSRKRALTNLSLSAEERYLELLRRYPEMNRRFPQKVIASYLGISAEFLSKIKKRLHT